MPFSLIPDLILPALTDLTPQLLRARGIGLLLMDFDNTIVPYTTDVPTEYDCQWRVPGSTSSRADGARWRPDLYGCARRKLRRADVDSGTRH